MAKIKGYSTGLAALIALSPVPDVPANDGRDLRDNPTTCMPRSELLESRQTRKNEVPTGLMGLHPSYSKLEVIGNFANGSYSVIGVATVGPNSGQTCLLTSSPGGFPEEIQQEPFWKKYFSQVSSNQSILKKFNGPK